MYLEDPEAKATTLAADRLQLNDRGEVKMIGETEPELTATLRAPREKLETQDYIVAFVDDNKDFLNFLTAHLGQIYTVHTYDDTTKACTDLEVLKPHIVVCKEIMPKMTGERFMSILIRRFSMASLRLTANTLKSSKNN